MKKNLIFTFLIIYTLNINLTYGKKIFETSFKRKIQITKFQNLFKNDSITVITYNIRYDSSRDGSNGWGFRKKGLVNMLKTLNPDIIGIQEGLKHQVEFLKTNLENFNISGTDRNNDLTGEYSSIFFNNLKFELIKSETFWLSKTPHIVSKSWDAALPRICTYVMLKHKQSNKNIYIFNTHLDHIGSLSRYQSSKIILNKIKQIVPKDGKVILMGDFNDSENSKTVSNVKSYLNDGKNISKIKVNTEVGTYNAFDIKSSLEYRLDYIFFRNIKIKTYEHVELKLENNLWPSDHLPVLASFNID